jgi:hypothetical protein
MVYCQSVKNFKSECFHSMDVWVPKVIRPEINLHCVREMKRKMKKSDAQVGRVKIFHTVQTIRKAPSNFKLCRKRPLRFSNL